jgi:hypothetical protein
MAKLITLITAKGMFSRYRTPAPQIDRTRYLNESGACAASCRESPKVFLLAPSDDHEGVIGGIGAQPVWIDVLPEIAEHRLRMTRRRANTRKQFRYEATTSTRLNSHGNGSEPRR